ncbi:hypothetical protein B484DRAFT_452932 [Ochromonadaceae sp. CCMP2298]|nr:hypothetical protein B484DRAFT_452932 [Ochromonadaceae sp. CCMP2298]|mmetsp:Transcript_2829/g.6535  ORF Transcript_2829/g.6535 Transcript_2829/m.6535 type:complete len:372 (+) Transcript_2829:87-1202(+)
MEKQSLVQAEAVVAYPVDAMDRSVVPTASWEKLMEDSSTFQIRQHVKYLPKHCCKCPPCVKEENTYSVYAGKTRDAQAEFLRVDEVSDDWNRCCCTPYHPLRLEVREFLPIPGDNTNGDWSHLTQDFRTQWGGFTSNAQKSAGLREMYKQQPVLYSMVRDDGQRCCYKCPCKVLNLCVCFDCCRDGMHIYSGPVADQQDKERGRPYNLDPSKQIGSVIQPTWGGCCIPTLHIRDGGKQDTEEPDAKIQGPCIFGGWSEMCCTFNFWVSTFNGKNKSGDLAVIKKLKPQSMGGAITELTSESDFYSIDFKEESLKTHQKVNILAGQLLADYMFFDGNTEKCDSDENFIYCYCFYCSILGWLRPCYIAIPKKV